MKYYYLVGYILLGLSVLVSSDIQAPGASVSDISSKISNSQGSPVEASNETDQTRVKRYVQYR